MDVGILEESMIVSAPCALKTSVFGVVWVCFEILFSWARSSLFKNSLLNMSASSSFDVGGFRPLDFSEWRRDPLPMLRDGILHMVGMPDPVSEPDRYTLFDSAIRGLERRHGGPPSDFVRVGGQLFARVGCRWIALANLDVAPLAQPQLPDLVCLDGQLFSNAIQGEWSTKVDDDRHPLLKPGTVSCGSQTESVKVTRSLLPLDNDDPPYLLMPTPCAVDAEPSDKPRELQHVLVVGSASGGTSTDMWSVGSQTCQRAVITSLWGAVLPASCRATLESAGVLRPHECFVSAAHHSVSRGCKFIRIGKLPPNAGPRVLFSRPVAEAKRDDTEVQLPALERVPQRPTALMARCDGFSASLSRIDALTSSMLSSVREDRERSSPLDLDSIFSPISRTVLTLPLQLEQPPVVPSFLSALPAPALAAQPRQSLRSRKRQRACSCEE